MNKKKLITGILLIVIGGAIIAFAPKSVSKPDYECAAPGEPYSGWVEGDCNLTDADYEKFREYKSAGKPLAKAALVPIVVGLVFTGMAFIRKK